MIKLLTLFCLTCFLSSCSLFTYLPTSNCNNVDYKRTGGNIHIEADCQV